MVERLKFLSGSKCFSLHAYNRDRTSYPYFTDNIKKIKAAQTFAKSCFTEKYQLKDGDKIVKKKSN